MHRWASVLLAALVIGSATLVAADVGVYEACRSNDDCPGTTSCMGVINPGNHHRREICSMGCSQDTDCIGSDSGCDSNGAGDTICVQHCGRVGDSPCHAGFTCADGICYPQ